MATATAAAAAAATATASPRSSSEEGAPLLDHHLAAAATADDDDDDDVYEPPPESPAPSASRPPVPTASTPEKPWALLVILVFILITIVDVGAFLAEPPKTRVFEANICLAYYEENDPSKIRSDGSVPETLCKIDEVQQKLAMIFGWQDTFDAIPGLLLAIPFGALADKWGRKWIFVASLVGLQLNAAWILLICYFRSLPLQMTWFSSAFFLIGGGPVVASALGITMISDIAPPDKRCVHHRPGKAFGLLTALALPSSCTSPPPCSLLKCVLPS